MMVSNRKTSWVVRNRETQEVLFETSDVRKIVYLNRPKYQSAEIGNYLASINGRIDAPFCVWF